MKKIIFFGIMSFCLYQLNAQTNITWKISETINKHYFKENTVFSGIYTGFKNEAEMKAFIQKIKEIPDVDSCEQLNDVNEGYSIKFKMKETHIGRYYMGFWAEELGIEYITINNVKKKAHEWIHEMGI